MSARAHMKWSGAARAVHGPADLHATGPVRPQRPLSALHPFASLADARGGDTRPGA